MANGIRIDDPRGFNKVRSSVKVSEFDKQLKKAGGHIGRNLINNSPKTLNDKNLFIGKQGSEINKQRWLFEILEFTWIARTNWKILKDKFGSSTYN